MKWRKLGLIYAPDGSRSWALSYALLPTAVQRRNGTLRVYYAALDAAHYGRVGYVDLDPDNICRVLEVSAEPVLDVGELGTFDDSGVNPSCLVEVHGRQYLYYIGWQRSERVPYMLFAGLAVSEDGERFTRHSQVPVLDRTRDEPFLRSATTVVSEEDGLVAWYVGAIGWITVHGRLYPSYVINSAVSVDGVNWARREGTSIHFKDDDEFGFGRPWVIKDVDCYRMWYSIRSRSTPYRLGYAESVDGVSWTRKDEEVGITAASSGWDSEMICYPCVFDIGSERYLLYNGNQHGRTGFGCAVLEKE